MSGPVEKAPEEIWLNEKRRNLLLDEISEGWLDVFSAAFDFSEKARDNEGVGVYEIEDSGNNRSIGFKYQIQVYPHKGFELKIFRQMASNERLIDGGYGGVAKIEYGGEDSLTFFPSLDQMKSIAYGTDMVEMEISRLSEEIGRRMGNLDDTWEKISE